MELKIDFNNPRILQGYKEQALIQADLEESAGRFVVGSEGGLAYTLFKDKFQRFPLHKDKFQGFPLQFRVCSVSEMAVVQDYFSAVQAYVTNAGKHAKQQGFGLVRVGDRTVISDGCGLDDFIYEAGLGSVNIESAERFQTFLDMIKSGKSELNKQYERIVEKAKLFPQKLFPHLRG